MACIVALVLTGATSAFAAPSDLRTQLWLEQVGPLTMRHVGSSGAELSSVATVSGLDHSPGGGESGIPHSAIQTTGLPSAPWFALLSTAGVATAYQLDRKVWQTYSDTTVGESHRIADAVAKLGDLRYLAPALLAGFAIGKAGGNPGLAASSVRIGISTLGAGASAVVVKAATGRSRPYESPGNPTEFAPFQGDASFPSGHTTIAFAFAAALDEETHSRWVPLIAYPAAAAVGWARIAQNQHWLSDVVAGAALGYWTGHQFDVRLQRRSQSALNASPLVDVGSKRGRLGVQVHF